jgi:hypothetical protein
VGVDVSTEEFRTKSQQKITNSLKTGKSFSIGNVSNKSYIHKLRNEEQIEFRECLVPFGPESVILPLAV